MELPDGRIIAVNSQPTPDGSGWVVTHEDITERRRTEMERDRSQAFATTVIENVPTTILLKDARTLRYVLVNKAGEQYLGVTRDKLIGKTADDVHADEEAAARRRIRPPADRGRLAPTPRRSSGHHAERRSPRRRNHPARRYGTITANRNICSPWWTIAPTASAPRPRSSAWCITTCSPACRTAPPSPPASTRRSRPPRARAHRLRCCASTSTASRRSTTSTAMPPATRCCASSPSAFRRRSAAPSWRDSAATSSS